jgi:branched-chain amino acid transport system substrate-binding protein
MKRSIIVVFACSALVAACTESDSEPTGAGTDTAAPRSEVVADSGPAPTASASSGTAASSTDATADTAASDGSVVSEFAGEEWFVGEVPATATAADPNAEPIVITMINQENSPAGSFPELRAASQAAVMWINTELGGVNGRPIQLDVCVTEFSVERSQECAQQAVESGSVAMTSGIDIGANASIPILEANGLPLVGGIPATLAEMRSPGAAFFSGGITGAYAAYLDDAASKGATKVAIAYGEFESFEVPVKDYAVPLAQKLGLETVLIPFPIIGADMLPVLTSAVDSGADAIIVAAADSACVPSMTTIDELGFEGELYLSGACAADEIIAQVPDEVQAKAIFNTEGPNEGTVEGSLFQAVIDRYATEPAGGAGTVSFRSTMNLWSLLLGLDTVDAASLGAALKSSVDQPSFWGHPFTCDGKQIPGMPSLCAPQQQLFSIPVDGGAAEARSDGWIDVPALLAN